MAAQALDTPKAALELDELHRFGPDLNLAFLIERSVVPVELRGGTLTVAMADVTDQRTIAALNFATGHDILPTPMAEAEIRDRLRALRPTGPVRVATVLGPLPKVESAEHARSLSQRVGQWLSADPAAHLALPGIAHLLEAGYAPVEAAEIVIGAGERSNGISPADRGVAERLRGGAELAGAVKTAGVPGWIGTALDSVPAADQVSALVTLLADAGSATEGRRNAAAIMLELAGWSVPVLLALQASSLAVTALVAAALAGLAINTLKVTRERPESDLVRADVLRTTATLAAHSVDEPTAIRAGLGRLSERAPTWGVVPDDRGGLANALSLPPVATAALRRGALANAAAREAARCTERAALVIGRARRMVRAAGLVALALALVLLLLR
ncbi:MAG: hypothetical protein ABIT09_05525 [Croceibacterium sp.]